MSHVHLQLDEALVDYMRAVSLREPEFLTRLRIETACAPAGAADANPRRNRASSWRC